MHHVRVDGLREAEDLQRAFGRVADWHQSLTSSAAKTRSGSR
jgi:hypothetical protein